MQDASLTSQNSLTNKEIFSLCKQFLLTKDYKLLDDICIKLDFYRCYRYNNDVYHSLLAGSLLYFIYYNVLTPDLQKFYFDIKLYLISFYNAIQNEMLRYKSLILEDKTSDNEDINVLIMNLILSSFYAYTKDERFLNLQEIDCEELITDLYLSNFATLNDIEIFGLIFSYNYLPDELSARTKDRFFRYIWEIITILIERADDVFKNQPTEEDSSCDIEAQVNALKI